MPKNFLILFVQFQCDLKKKEKGPSSEFCKFSPRFVRHTRARCREPQLSTVFGGKQTRQFWREKKRQNSQNFSAKMPEKISHFFALIGNTAKQSPLPKLLTPSHATIFLNKCQMISFEDIKHFNLSITFCLKNLFLEKALFKKTFSKINIMFDVFEKKLKNCFFEKKTIYCFFTSGT